MGMQSPRVKPPAGTEERRPPLRDHSWERVEDVDVGVVYVHDARKLQVLSAIERDDDRDALFFHVSVVKRAGAGVERATDEDVAFVREVFSMSDAEEENLTGGKARHLWARLQEEHRCIRCNAKLGASEGLAQRMERVGEPMAIPARLCERCASELGPSA